MRVNLLPPEIRQRQQARRRTGAVVAVGLIVLLAVGAIYVLLLLRVDSLRRDLEDQQAQNTQLQAQIAELQRVDELQRELDAGRQLLAGLLSDQVLWSGVLRDVSLVIPGQAWLTGVTGTTEERVEGEAPTGEPGLAGQISFNGFAFEHRDVALWLARLEDVRGFVNPWLSSSAKTLLGTTEVVQFTNTVDLSEDALARTGGPQ